MKNRQHGIHETRSFEKLEELKEHGLEEFLEGIRRHHKDVQEVLRRMDLLMSKFDELITAVDASISKETASVDKAVQVMQAAVDALNNGTPADDAAVQAVIDKVTGANSQTDRLDTASNALSLATPGPVISTRRGG